MTDGARGRRWTREAGCEAKRSEAQGKREIDCGVEEAEEGGGAVATRRPANLAVRADLEKI